MTEVYLTAHALTLVLEIIDLIFYLHLHTLLTLGCDMVLREVDFNPLSETPSFTSSYSKVAKTNNNKLVQMNSVIRNNFNTIQ